MVEDVVLKDGGDETVANVERSGGEDGGYNVASVGFCLSLEDEDDVFDQRLLVFLLRSKDPLKPFEGCSL